MPLSKRDFLKLTAVGLGTLALRPFSGLDRLQFPDAEKLGRVTVEKMDLKTRPDENSQTVGTVYEDNIIPWLREVVGSQPGRINQRWVETPSGYIWGGYVKPVYNKPNLPVTTLPQSSLGPGMWVEVTVPYADLVLDNPPARAPWLQYQASIKLPTRFYYSQIVWADQIRTDENGQVWYRLNEKYGSGDIFWSRAEAFRPLSPEDVASINPEVEDKRIQVNLWYQTLSCFEGNREVYFARISSGALFNADGVQVDAWATPLGEAPIWRKAISLPLSGGSALLRGGACLLSVGSVFLWEQAWLSIPHSGTTILGSRLPVVA